VRSELSCVDLGGRRRALGSGGAARNEVDLCLDERRGERRGVSRGVERDGGGLVPAREAEGAALDRVEGQGVELDPGGGLDGEDARERVEEEAEEGGREKRGRRE
jgi:hypothetical protein